MLLEKHLPLGFSVCLCAMSLCVFVLLLCRLVAHKDHSYHHVSPRMRTGSVTDPAFNRTRAARARLYAK